MYICLLCLIQCAFEMIQTLSKIGRCLSIRIDAERVDEEKKMKSLSFHIYEFPHKLNGELVRSSFVLPFFLSFSLSRTTNAQCESFRCVVIGIVCAVIPIQGREISFPKQIPDFISFKRMLTVCSEPFCL